MHKITVFILFSLLLGLVASQRAADTTLMVIDSDGGADDAVAILIVLNDPQVDVLAITCSYGNVHRNQSCDNIRRTLQEAGRADIPVYAGCDKPFLTDPIYDNFYGVDGFSNASLEFPLPDQPIQPGHASNELISLANEYPGELVVVALGPLTDLAVALKLDPSFPEKLKHLVIMGGTARAIGNIEAVAEFNMYDDPEAAKIVIGEYDCPILFTPFEMGLKYGAPWSWYDQWVSVNSSTAYFIREIWQVVSDDRVSNPTFVCCDCQAVTAYLYPETVTNVTNRYADVETCGEITRGQLVVDYRDSSNAEPNVVLVTAFDLPAMLDKWQQIV